MLNPKVRQLDIEVFTGVNDAPTAPTETKGCNGSFVVSRLNSLVGAFLPPQQSWADGDSLFLDSALGDDVNDGLSLINAVLTWERLIEIAASKQVLGTLYLRLAGTVNPPFDFSGLTARKSQAGSPPARVTVTKVLGGSNPIVDGEGLLIAGSPPNDIEIAFESCTFNVTSAGLTVLGTTTPLTFDTCQFNAMDTAIPATLLVDGGGWVEIIDGFFGAATPTTGAAVQATRGGRVKLSGCDISNHAQACKSSILSHIYIDGSLGDNTGFEVELGGKIYFLTPSDNLTVTQAVGTGGGEYVRVGSNSNRVLLTYPTLNTGQYYLIAGGDPPMLIKEVWFTWNGDDGLSCVFTANDGAANKADTLNPTTSIKLKCVFNSPIWLTDSDHYLRVVFSAVPSTIDNVLIQLVG